MSDKRKKTFAKIAIITSGFGIFSDNIIAPLLTAIFTEFPDSSIVLRNFVISGGYLFGLATALFSGVFARYVSKRKLMIIGSALFCLGGIGGVFSPSMEFLAFTRVLDGLSDGLLTVIALSLIPQVFDTDKERSQVIGFRFAAQGTYGLIMSVAAGYICLYLQWRYAFLLNIVSIVPLIFSVIGLPETPLDKKPVKGVKTDMSKVPMPAVLVTIFSLLIYGPLFIVLPLCGDLYVTQTGIGNSVLTGYAGSIMSLTAIVMGLTFSMIYMRTKRATPVIGYALLAMAFALLGLKTAAGVFLFCAGLASVGNLFLANYFENVICKIVPVRNVSLVMSIYIFTLNLAIYAAPYVPYLTAYLTGINTFKMTFLIIGIVMFVMMLISILLWGVEKKNPASGFNLSENLKLTESEDKNCS